jgi:hypothetical protein
MSSEMARKARLDPLAKYELEDHDKHKYHPQGTPSQTTKMLMKKFNLAKDIPREFLEYQAENSAFRPSEKQKRMVWQMGAMGATVEIIRLAISDPESGLPLNLVTFNSHFLHILQHAREQANIKIALKIFELALGQDAEYDEDGHILKPYCPPNLDALKWWDRTRGEARGMFGMKSVVNSVVDGNGPVMLVIEGS